MKALVHSGIQPDQQKSKKEARMLSKQIHLAARPVGEATIDCFKLVEVELPALGSNQLLVRNTFMSVDPYMRPRMDDADSYIEPFQLGEALEGDAIGEVVVSTSDAFNVGDRVTHFGGWRDIAIIEAEQARQIDRSDDVAESTHLGVLGVPGFTAYVGLLHVAQLRDGDEVFVSGAAGAVGSLAGQLASQPAE